MSNGFLRQILNRFTKALNVAEMVERDVEFPRRTSALVEMLPAIEVPSFNEFSKIIFHIGENLKRKDRT